MKFAATWRWNNNQHTAAGVFRCNHKFRDGDNGFEWLWTLGQSGWIIYKDKTANVGAAFGRKRYVRTWLSERWNSTRQTPPCLWGWFCNRLDRPSARVITNPLKTALSMASKNKLFKINSKTALDIEPTIQSRLKDHFSRLGWAKKFKFIISMLYLNWIHVFETIVKQLSRLISKCLFSIKRRQQKNPWVWPSETRLKINFYRQQRTFN